MTEERARELTKPYLRDLTDSDGGATEVFILDESDVVKLLMEHGKEQIVCTWIKDVSIGQFCNEWGYYYDTSCKHQMDPPELINFCSWCGGKIVELERVKND